MITYIADLFSLIFYGEKLDADVGAIKNVLADVWTQLLNALNGFGGGTANLSITTNWNVAIPVICSWIVTIIFAFGLVNLLMRLFRIIR